MFGHMSCSKDFLKFSDIIENNKGLEEDFTK